MASIQVIQGTEKGRTFQLREGQNVIGRQSETMPVTDGTVSRRHSSLDLVDGNWILQDLGSGNGTYLNGVKLEQSTIVHAGDQIRCGSALLVFALSDVTTVDVDENGRLVDAAIVARLRSNEDSIIMPTIEAGAQAIDNLRILYDFISETSSIFDVDRLLVRTLDKVFDVLTADRGYILLIDSQGNLTPKASRIPEGQMSKDMPISRTIINEVVGEEVGVLSSNAMGDQRFASGKSVHNFGIRSAICVPIKGRDRILGVIHVDCSVSDYTYSTEQLRLLTAIGYQTGLAIDNVNLHDQAVQGERLAAVGETVARMSHHVKNVLQALSGGIHVVEMSLDRDNLAKAKESWPMVQRNVGRINDLIMNMLAFSKEREPLLEQTSITRLLGECIEMQLPTVDLQDIALLTDLGETPPISADPVGLRQAFTNLLTNAIDAVPEQSGAITVTSRYEPDHHRVLVEVTDNGPGIEADKLADIFKPFWSSKGHKGTGLGLAVAKKVVDEHGGSIDISSAVGEGATFRIRLPEIQDAEPGDTSTPV